MNSINYLSIAKNNGLSILELLPSEMINNVLNQLNQVTGTKGMRNEADIAVIMKYARSLACTSKRIYACINNIQVTELFLNSLSKKYGHSPEHLAALLNTTGARKWLWEYIKQRGDNKVYQVIQDIYKIATQILKEAKENSLDFNYFGGQGSPQPHYYQTQHGFLLYNNLMPNHIATPFGKIQIFGEGRGSRMSQFSVSEAIIKRLHATFEKIEFVKISDEETFFEIKSSSNESHKIRKLKPQDFTKISKQELENKKGAQDLIISSSCTNYSVYKIGKIGDQELPDIAWYADSEPQRSPILINVIWEMLEREHSGKNPILKEVKTRRIIKQSCPIPLFNDLSEIIPWGIDLVKQLIEQPIFPTKGKDGRTIKALALENYIEAYFLELLNHAAQNFLEENNDWNISTFGTGNKLFLNERDMGTGLKLFLNSCDKYKYYDLDTLLKAYQAVLESVSLGWERVSLKDYSTVSFIKSEEEYVFFIKKKKPFPTEAVFLSSLASQLGISNFISCSDDWKDRSFNAYRPTYLWIKKERLEEVASALKILVSV